MLKIALISVVTLIGSLAWAQTDKPHDVVENVPEPLKAPTGQVPAIVAPRPLSLLEPEGKRIYHAVCINAENAAVYPARIKAYSDLVGHRPSVGVQFAHAYDATKALTWDYHANVLRTIDREGLIPFMKATTQSWANGKLDETGFYFKADDVLAGKHDAFFIKAAQVCKDFGKPMFITWNHEMNGDWYSYSEVLGKRKYDAGWTAEKYVQFHRKVWKIFKDQGAGNVAFGFSPAVLGRKIHQYDELNSWKAYWPGEEYVDWVAPSYYNNDNPIEMDSLASQTNKPIFVSEWGTEKNREKWYRPQPYPGDAAWMKTTLDYWMHRYPNMKGSAYYQWEAGFLLQRNPDQVPPYIDAINDPMFIHGPTK